MKKIFYLTLLLGVLACEKDDDDDYGSDSSYIVAVESSCSVNA